jgi:hypothetical protein
MIWAQSTVAMTDIRFIPALITRKRSTGCLQFGSDPSEVPHLKRRPGAQDVRSVSTALRWKGAIRLRVNRCCGKLEKELPLLPIWLLQI